MPAMPSMRAPAKLAPPTAAFGKNPSTSAGSATTADADLAEGSRHELDARAARERRLDRGGTSAFERLSRRQNGAPANIAGAAVSVPS